MSVHFQYKNESTEEIWEVWYDNATTLRTKYDWSIQQGMGGAGVWTPGAAHFDAAVSAELWDAIRVPGV